MGVYGSPDVAGSNVSDDPMENNISNSMKASEEDGDEMQDDVADIQPGNESQESDTESSPNSNLDKKEPDVSNNDDPQVSEDLSETEGDQVDADLDEKEPVSDELKRKPTSKMEDLKFQLEDVEQNINNAK